MQTASWAWLCVKTGSLQNVSNLMGFMRTKSGTRVPFVFYTNSLSYDQKTRDLVKYHKIASPHLGYERYVLEQIYDEKVMGRDFWFWPILNTARCALCSLIWFIAGIILDGDDQVGRIAHRGCVGIEEEIVLWKLDIVVILCNERNITCSMFIMRHTT